MAWTKGQIVAEAFAELGLGSFAYSIQPEDQQTALRRLRALMQQWNESGIVTGFTLADSVAEEAASDASGINEGYIRGVICSLAVEIAPNYGKNASVQTMMAARQGKALMRRATVVVPDRILDTAAIPAGAGNKLGWRIDLVADENADTNS